MLAWHAEAAGIEDAVDDRSAWAIRADAVEMWTGVFVCTHRFFQFYSGASLNIVACRMQKIQRTKEHPLIIPSIGTWSKGTISIEVAEQKGDDKRLRDWRPGKCVAFARRDAKPNKIVNELLASNAHRE